MLEMYSCSVDAMHIMYVGIIKCISCFCCHEMCLYYKAVTLRKAC
jgi:hypothetical protein